jgi:hypothetical protein
MCVVRRFRIGKPESFNPLSLEYNVLGEEDERPFRHNPQKKFVPISDVADPDQGIDAMIEAIDREIEAGSGQYSKIIPSDNDGDDTQKRIVKKGSEPSSGMVFSCQKALRFH